MISSSGVCSKWVLVHDGVRVIVFQENFFQDTSSIHIIELFDTEEELSARIDLLQLIPVQLRTKG
jgi:hypothetical protein